MKKLFTTILLMGVALASWGILPPDPTEGPDPHFEPSTGVLTVRYNQYVNKNKNADEIVKQEWRGKVTKLVLIGEYSNEDCNAIDGMINRGVGGDGSTKTLYLDLEGCTGFFCKVQPAGNKWTSSEYEYYYTDAMTTQNVVKVSKLFENGQIFTGDQNALVSDGQGSYYYYAWSEDGAPYTGDTSTLTQDDEDENLFHYATQESEDGTPKHDPIFYDDAEGKYYFDDWYNGQGPKHYLVDVTHNVTRSTVSVTEQSVWVLENNQNSLVDEDAHEITLIDETHGTIPVHAYGTKFFETFNSKKFLNGITFPCGSDFLAIPEKFLRDADSNNSADNKITTVSFGENSSLQWIGREAFMNLTSLNDVTFPQTVKVIGVDAFYKCISFTTVDLRIRDLVKVDAAAFNMEKDYDSEDPYASFAEGNRPQLLNNLRTVYLPGTKDEPNNTLEFFGNQVFSSSLITELDFQYCHGIKHFGYDGEEYFGETVPQGIANTTRTFTWHRFLTKVTLPPNLLHVGDECFFKCQALEELYFTGKADYNENTCPETNVLNNPLTIGSMACNSTPLNTLQLSDNVTVIGERAFSKTSLTEVRIPASVQVIETMAFEDQTDAEGNMTLKTVVFEEIDANCAPCQHAKTNIKAEAFLENTAISDVYVNTIVDIDCENHGFPFEITFAQGDATAASQGQAATLHFPAGHEEHYTNLKHYLTNEVASDAGLFQAWLVAHFDAAQDQSSGFGWYEFVNTGSKSPDDPVIDPDPENPDKLPLILRTFSDPQYARIVPDGLRAYVVNKVEKSGTKYELTLQRIPVIPAQTGVILFGQPNTKTETGKYTLAMSAVGYQEGHGQPLRRDYWDTLAKQVTEAQGKQGIEQPDAVRLKNYLMPIIPNAKIRTVDGETETLKETNLLTVNPYEPYKTGEPVKWRNFALNRMDQTAHLQGKFAGRFNAAAENFAGFFRILPGTYKSGYAYLHLSAVADATTGQVVEYDDPKGAECVVKPDADYYIETNVEGTYDPRDNPNLNWWKGTNTWKNMIDGWGERAAKFDQPDAVVFLGELEDTDGVVKLVIPESKMDEVFSISGMKVTKPSKGIYIQNGKKIIIK